MDNQLAHLVFGLPGQILAARRNGQLTPSNAPPRIDPIEGVPAVWIGRHTRNLLPRQFAPLDQMPEPWRRLDGLELRSNGVLDVDARRGAATLMLPQVKAHPRDALLDHGTTFVGVIYQFSVDATGAGKLTLRLRDAAHRLETHRTVIVRGAPQRPCVALDGPLDPRVLEAAIVVENGIINIGRLMLEPYVFTYRTAQRALLFPCPGTWTPGGEERQADRLEVNLPPDTVPVSGMIDFWVRPAWDAAHPNHTFFDTAHWYFGFGFESQEPLFHAGDKPCPWMYYCEWCAAHGFKAGSWHHGAVTWDADGSAAVYWDGQCRAFVQQTPKHALDPTRVGNTMVIGAKTDVGMFCDPNVSSELEGYLAWFKLTAGPATAEDVLAALESSRPVPAPVDVPAKAIFFGDSRRSEVVSAKDYFWFAHQLELDHDRDRRGHGRRVRWFGYRRARRDIAQRWYGASPDRRRTGPTYPALFPALSDTTETPGPSARPRQTQVPRRARMRD